MERIRVLATDWAENGFGAPRMVHTIYIVKLVFFYALGGIAVATLTSRLPAFWHVSEWWNQPIVYQKVILWTVLLETIGVAGSWGPLAGKLKPMTGGILFWARTGNDPAAAVEAGAVHRRRPAHLVRRRALPRADGSVVVPLLLPGVHSDSLSAAVPGNTSGLVNPALLIVPMVLLVLIGLRDKIDLPGRARRAVPAGAGLLHRAAVHRHDHRAQAADRRGLGRRRLLEVRQALRQRGAADGQQQPRRAVPVDQAGPLPRLPARHPPVPARPPDGTRRRDLRGDHRAAGAVALRRGKPVTLAAVAVMVGFHLFIISTFPLAVPLEWNVLFGYAAVFLFAGFPNWNGYAPWNMSPPWLALVIVAGAAVLPGAGQPAARPGVRSCPRCGSTPATGRPRCGRSRRVPRRS